MTSNIWRRSSGFEVFLSRHIRQWDEVLAHLAGSGIMEQLKQFNAAMVLLGDLDIEDWNDQGDVELFGA